MWRPSPDARPIAEVTAVITRDITRVLKIDHDFHRGRFGRCVFPVRRGDHFAPCGKMQSIHLTTRSLETVTEGYG